MHARCIRCHSPDGKGPMSLVTYEDARPYASAMREEVLARRMPKWHAARGYGQFANDPRSRPSTSRSSSRGWTEVRCAAIRQSPERRFRYGRHHRPPPEDSRSHVATLRSRPGASWRSRRRCARAPRPGSRSCCLAAVTRFWRGCVTTKRNSPTPTGWKRRSACHPAAGLHAEAPYGCRVTLHFAL